MCAGVRVRGWRISLGPWVYFSIKSEQPIGGLFFQLEKKGKESEKKTWQEKVAASKSTAASDTSPNWVTQTQLWEHEEMSVCGCAKGVWTLVCVCVPKLKSAIPLHLQVWRDRERRCPAHPCTSPFVSEDIPPWLSLHCLCHCLSVWHQCRFSKLCGFSLSAPSFPPGMGKKDDPKLMQEWFKLVQEKNALVRYESELMIL